MLAGCVWFCKTVREYMRVHDHCVEYLQGREDVVTGLAQAAQLVNWSSLAVHVF